MQTRESGMPPEDLWHTFFSPHQVLMKLGLTSQCQDVADFGCGYGTFSIPAAEVIAGSVYAFDINPAMIAATASKAKAMGLSNVQTRLRDFVAEGTDLPDDCVDYVMLFNILHAEDPLVLLREARRILIPGGRLGIMHWNYDSTTPRGPSMDIRPRPEQCRLWTNQAGFQTNDSVIIDLPPYHYGFSVVRV